MIDELVTKSAGSHVSESAAVKMIHGGWMLVGMLKSGKGPATSVIDM